MRLEKLIEQFEGEISRVEEFLFSVSELVEENTGIFVRGFDGEGVVYFELPSQNFRDYFARNCEEIPVNANLFGFGSDYEKNFSNRNRGFGLGELFVDKESKFDIQSWRNISSKNYIDKCNENVAKTVKRFDLETPAKGAKEKRALIIVKEIVQHYETNANGVIPIYMDGDKVGQMNYKKIIEQVYNHGDELGKKRKVKTAKGLKSPRTINEYLKGRDKFKGMRIKIDCRKKIAQR